MGYQLTHNRESIMNTPTTTEVTPKSPTKSVTKSPTKSVTKSVTKSPTKSKPKLKSKTAKAKTAILGYYKQHKERPSRPVCIKLFTGSRIGMTPKGASSVYGSLKDKTIAELQGVQK